MSLEYLNKYLRVVKETPFELMLSPRLAAELINRANKSKEALGDFFLLLTKQQRHAIEQSLATAIFSTYLDKDPLIPVFSVIQCYFPDDYLTPKVAPTITGILQDVLADLVELRCFEAYYQLDATVEAARQAKGFSKPAIDTSSGRTYPLETPTPANSPRFRLSPG